MNKRKILFIVNPISGDTDKSAFLGLLEQKSKIPEFTVIVYQTTGTEDEEKIKSEVKKFKPDTLVAVGGDGTVRLVARLLINTDITLGILPMGSANGMAYDLGLPSQTGVALDLIFEGKSKPIDAIKLNDDKYCFHLSDLGVNSRIIKSFEDDDKRGFLGYLFSFFKETKNIEKFLCEVTTDNSTIRHKAIMLVIANGSYYGTGANINPGGSLNDGKFEVILIKPHSLMRMIKLAFAFFMRTFHKQQITKIISCRKATIKIQPKQYLQIDGEIESKTDFLSAEIIPNAFRVIVGDEQQNLKLF